MVTTIKIANESDQPLSLRILASHDGVIFQEQPALNPALGGKRYAQFIHDGANITGWVLGDQLDALGNVIRGS